MEGDTLHDQILIFLRECPVLGLVSNDARSHEYGDHFVDMNWFPAIRLMVTRSLRAVYTTVEKASGRSRMLGQDMVI